MVVLQFVSMRLSFSRNMPDMGDNPMAQSQRSMMYVMPLMFIFSGAFFQMGVVIYTVTASFWALAQSFWTIKVMPTPGSPAYADLLSSRESAYQEWAKPYFQNYDRERAALGNSATTRASTNSTSALSPRFAPRPRSSTSPPTSPPP